MAHVPCGCGPGWYKRTLQRIRDQFSCVVLVQDEDQICLDYHKEVAKLLSGAGRRWADPDLDQDMLVKEIPLEDTLHDTLSLGECVDLYENHHRLLIWRRIRNEMRDLAKNSIRLFYLSLLQFVLGVVVIALGTSELQGGKVEVFVASYVSGGVMILSSVVGFVGILAENEGMIRGFLIANYWIMAVLTTYMYVEVHFMTENENVCNSSLSDYDSTQNHCSRRGTIVASLVMSLVSLLTVFSNSYFCTAWLDTTNDRTTIIDNLLVFRYFQYRHNRLSKVILEYLGVDQLFDGASPLHEPSGAAAPPSPVSCAGSERVRMTHTSRLHE